MVAIVFTLTTLSFGTLGAISVFLKPLAAEFGWSRADTALGYTAIAFSSALFGILWGVIADRYGTRWFGVLAAIAMSVALMLLSTQESLIEFYLFYFIFGALGNAVCSQPLFANVGFWFQRNPGLALGITAAGGAMGQGIVPYLAGIGIEQWGWRATYELMAVFYFVIAMPIAFFIRESPERQRVLSASDTVISERTFPLSEFEVIVWISVAVIFCCNCMAVPIVHLVPLLTDTGHTLSSATSVLLVLMLAGVAGRIMGGKLADIIGALPGYFLMSLGQTAFVAWFVFLDHLIALYVLAIVFGFTYSGVMSSILVCTRMLVSARLAARAMAITSFFGWGGMGLGGYFGGLFYDLSGSYLNSFLFAAAAGGINLVILLLFMMRIRRHGPGHLVPAGSA
ncbi:MAG: MFS transporter [Pseudomonadota bacterium]